MQLKQVINNMNIETIHSFLSEIPAEKWTVDSRHDDNNEKHCVMGLLEGLFGRWVTSDDLTPLGLSDYELAAVNNGTKQHGKYVYDFMGQTRTEPTDGPAIKERVLNYLSSKL